MKKKSSNKNEPLCLAYCDADGNLFDFPGIEPVFRTGNSFIRIDPKELIDIPFGSDYFSLPGRYPVFYNHKNEDFNHIEVSIDGDEITAVSVHPASAYLRTYLPAYITPDGSEPLPMWSYTPVVFSGDRTLIPAIRIDDDPRSDPAVHQDMEPLNKSIDDTIKKNPSNRLVSQLKKCSLEYGCLCARNFFIGRHEAPVPTSPVCNSDCAGCLSNQNKSSGFKASHGRLDFLPTPEEIAQVIIQHFERVKQGVASFGQGCEGEPLLRGDDLCAAVRSVREKTDGGTININTNGSIPSAVKNLISAGIDSIRFSMNSPTEKYYTSYHRPKNYSYDDLMKSIACALDAGIFVSINLFFMPGFTDMESEVRALDKFLDRFPANMIQTRNLNIDPDLYFRIIGFEESPAIGIRGLIEHLKSRAGLKLGYYNPPKEKFR